MIINKQIIILHYKDTKRKIRITFFIEYCGMILVPNCKPGELRWDSHISHAWTKIWNRSNFHSLSYLPISIFTTLLTNTSILWKLLYCVYVSRPIWYSSNYCIYMISRDWVFWCAEQSNMTFVMIYSNDRKNVLLLLKAWKTAFQFYAH